MRSIRRAILTTAASLLGGGVFYAVWLAVFLLLTKNGAASVTLLWVLSPVVTAVGFTTGVLLADRIRRKVTTPFLPVYWWPLAGCILGAVLVYWYGPMLIVFSMLVFGTLSILLREIRFSRKRYGD